MTEEDFARPDEQEKLPDDHGGGDLAYTDSSACEFCGAELYGSAFQCGKCNSLVCTSCICVDGSCPACVNSGRPDLPEG